ncbi:ATP-dependent Clp protease adapter ClpS [Desulfohalovibrio reitneri]|uniref:ATP-dependent Clp protease adapter ClpS n=1 Tax=Desulfohalovibrio reitneri TaxID=1307759 RepID=UPI0004A75DBE|nr:ATP-dependent Clp protease adapter ClpS [Desulfohalovibrio reitneri]
MPLERRDTETFVEDEVREPRRYKVLLHNDDYTTMEFVVKILREVFSKTEDEAMRIMLHVHNNGKGVCGVFTHEVAETKVTLVHNLARQAGYPLKSSMEEV